MRLIDLDAFREEYDLLEHCEDCGRRNKKACDYPLYSARDFCGWLDDAPTVDAAPVTHGKWHKPMNYYVQCNLCGNTYEMEKPQPTARWNYCPGCGAKMDLEETK